MKRIVALLLIGVFTLALPGCCSFCQDITRSYHENNATFAVLNASMEKITAAIPEAALKAGYSVNQTKSTLGEFEYKGDGLKITGKKLDDKKTKIFIRSGFFSDTDRQGLVLREVKKELRLK